MAAQKSENACGEESETKCILLLTSIPCLPTCFVLDCEVEHAFRIQSTNMRMQCPSYLSLFMYEL